MRPFLCACRAELLKLKRTLALWLVLIMPSAAAILIFLEFVRRPDSIFLGDHTEGWHYLVSEVPSFWAVLLLPLFIPLQAALINSVEHNTQGWKHLFALPTPRWTILGAKYLMLLLSVVGAFVVMSVEILAFGLFAQATNLRPVVPFDPFPGQLLASAFLGQIVASLFLIAVHAGLSIRVRSFTAAIGVGIAGTVVSYFLNTTPLGQYFPYSMPGLVTSYVTDSGIVYYAQPDVVPSVLVYSAELGVLLTIVGIITLAHRDVL
jgi:hypothetical protein